MLVASTTFQTVSTDSPEWRKLLRRIIRDRGDGWTIRATSPEWRIEFRREIKGKLGEPDQEIRISTDARITCPADSRFGLKQSFDDSKPVEIPKPDRCWLRYSSVSTVCHLLLNGGRLEIDPSSGSTSSSHHGLSFVALAVVFPDVSYSRAEIGCTVYVNGRRVISGPLE